MLNKYIDRLERLLDRYRSQELSQFRGPADETAQWDDLIWFHIDPNSNRKTRFLSGRHGIKGRRSAGNKPEFALRYPYSHLVKVWIIETTNTRISASERQARISATRLLLSSIAGELFEQTHESIARLISHRSRDRVNPFLAFCAKNGLMRPIQFSITDDRDRTGHAQFDAKVEKLPDIESILALGSIYSTIFQPVSQNGVDLHPNLTRVLH